MGAEAIKHLLTVVLAFVLWGTLVFLMALVGMIFWNAVLVSLFPNVPEISVLQMVGLHFLAESFYAVRLSNKK